MNPALNPDYPKEEFSQWGVYPQSWDVEFQFFLIYISRLDVKIEIQTAISEEPLTQRIKNASLFSIPLLSQPQSKKNRVKLSPPSIFTPPPHPIPIPKAPGG